MTQSHPDATYHRPLLYSVMDDFGNQICVDFEMFCYNADNRLNDLWSNIAHAYGHAI